MKRQGDRDTPYVMLTAKESSPQHGQYKFHRPSLSVVYVLGSQGQLTSHD